MNDKVAVYTCIAGDYDELLEPSNNESGADYFCFSDRQFPHSGRWKLLPLPAAHGDSVLDSRFVKMHPHLLFPEHSCSVYVDGNVQIRGKVSVLGRSALQDGVLAMYVHPFRDCIFDEARECAALGHDWFWRIRDQMDRYAAAGFPAHYGLLEANVLIRRHHDSRLIHLMEAWWREFTGGVRRDQLSLAFLLWKYNFPVVNLGESDARFAQEYLVAMLKHRKQTSLLGKFRRKVNKLASKVVPWQVR